MNTPRVDHPGRILEWMDLPARFEEPRFLRFFPSTTLGLILLVLSPPSSILSVDAGILALLLAGTVAAERAGRLERRWLEVTASGIRVRMSRQRNKHPVEIPWDAIVSMERSSESRSARTFGQPHVDEPARLKIVDRTVLHLDPARTAQRLVRVPIEDFTFGLTRVGLANLILQVRAGLAGSQPDFPVGIYLREGRRREPWNGSAWVYEEKEAAEQQIEARLPRPVYLLYRAVRTLVGILVAIALLVFLLLDI